MDDGSSFNPIDVEERRGDDVEDPDMDQNVGGIDLNLCEEEQPDEEVGEGALATGDDEQTPSFEEASVTPLKGVVGGPPVPPPVVGMVFPSMEAVDDYYRRYGVQQGFGVVRAASSTYRGNDTTNRKPRNALWTCDRYGKPKRKRKSAKKSLVTDSQLVEEENVKASKKCECSAMIYASVNLDKEWQLRKVVVEHKNHNPTPSKAAHLVAVRKQKFTAHVKRKLMLGCAAGLKPAQVHNILAKERNGLEELGLRERDIRNEMDKEKRLKLEPGDAVAMLDYFDKMTEGNQNFWHTYRLDEADNMQDIIWVDARCRAAYEEFSDVVVFDTTYLTNKYHLPFANFVGVNHHGQTILLGCALISRETTETFIWVFSKWLHCMNGRAPGGILTDQAAAMRRALSVTMPETTHRWCIWHITSKFPDKLGKCNGYSEFKEELMRAIYDSLTPEEFELTWSGVIEAYGLEENDWLQGLFEEREMWVPAHTKHLFWAGMKTTQRVESIHSFFDDYVNPQTRLREFAESYCEAMEFRAQSERELDATSETTTLELVSGFASEALFQRCYTNSKFKEVQRECSRTINLHCISETAITDTQTEYQFEDRVWCRNRVTKKDFLTQYRRNYRAVYDRSTNLVECECKLFNSSGIMCRHMIKLYDIIHVFDVPQHYILRRWRKDIQRKHSRMKVAYHDPTKTEQVRDYDWLNGWFDRISSRAVIHKSSVHVTAELLETMEIRVEEDIARVENQLLQLSLTQTPSSVCNKKGKDNSTPASTTAVASKRKASAPSNAEGVGVCLVEGTVGAERAPPRRVVNDPPIPLGKSIRTAKRFQSAVEKAVNKIKSRGNSSANPNGPGKVSSRQRKGKEAATDDSIMISGKVATRSKTTRARQTQGCTTNTETQVTQSIRSVACLPAMQAPPIRAYAPENGRIALPVPPYGSTTIPYYYRPSVPAGYPSAQRVLFPQQVEDHQSSMHDSNSPAKLDVQLKL